MKKLSLLTIALASVMTVGCATTKTVADDMNVNVTDAVQEVVANTGVVTDEVKFPAIEKAWYSADGQYRGSFPNWSNVAQVDYGLSKDQLYTLLDRPHYSEGLYGVKKWNYVLNYRDNGTVEQCQLQIHFDKNKQVEGIYWKDPKCQEYAKTANKQVINNIVQKIEAPQGATLSETLTLEADALFAFNKFSINDMLPQGRHSLQQAVAKIKELSAQERVTAVIVGHTDRLGDEGYNLSLSDKRAKTVLAYMLSQGISPANITAVGAGEYLPVTHCADGKRDNVIRCLQPNRRVEIQLYTYK